MQQVQSFTARSSFATIILGPTGTGQEVLQRECRRIINSKEKVEIREIEPKFLSFPYILRLILSLYATLSDKLNYYSSESAYFKSPLTTHLKYSLLKLLANIIEKRLFVCTESPKLYDQMSFSLLFKQCLFSMVLSVLSENTNFVVLEKLISFYKNLSSEQPMLFLPIHLYHLFGGCQYSIQAATFRAKVTAMVQALGKVLATSDTIINRNIQHFKASSERSQLLQESVKVVLMSRDKRALPGLVSYLCKSIFGEKEQLGKEEFVSQLHTHTLEPVLSVFLLLLRSEMLLFEEKSFRRGLQLRAEIPNTNFYTSQLAKLFSKCPFNGDDKCNCKKCQCVRRNRESAKLSQERKRTALEQLEGLRNSIKQLEEHAAQREKQVEESQEQLRREEEKGVALEEENLMLRTLLAQMQADPTLKMLMLQPVSPSDFISPHSP